MSVFTSFTQVTLSVPGADGESIVIRRLAPKHLDAARAVNYRKSLRDMRQLYDEAGKEVIAEFQKAASDGSAAGAARSEPLMQYDAVTLIEHGVVSWTFSQPLGRESYEDMNEDAQHWLATEVLKLAKPSLYQTADEAEADRKNG